MRAILLAAGFGTRLMPLTANIPKCLVPIKGRPLLDYWLDRLTQAGIGPFLINTHYLSEHVAAFIQSSVYRDQVTLVNEAKLLGTAGTLIANLGYFGGKDGLLIHADNYCLADFKAFEEAHHNRPLECQMTMMTFRTSSPSDCGILELDRRGVVVGFYEKVENPPGNLANGAVYMLSAELINRLESDFKKANDFSTDVVQDLMGSIYTYETHAVFQDIGTPETYRAINEL